MPLILAFCLVSSGYRALAYPFTALDGCFLLPHSSSAVISPLPFSVGLQSCNVACSSMRHCSVPLARVLSALRRAADSFFWLAQCSCICIVVVTIHIPTWLLAVVVWWRCHRHLQRRSRTGEWEFAIRTQNIKYSARSEECPFCVFCCIFSPMSLLSFHFGCPLVADVVICVTLECGPPGFSTLLKILAHFVIRKQILISKPFPLFQYFKVFQAFFMWQ